MPNKMERFTQGSRRVLSLAQAEAEQMQQTYIGPEHLLIGLMHEEGGIAGRVLRELGLDLQRVRELVERMTRNGSSTIKDRLDLSAPTKKILELAVSEARRLGHHSVGTEHLLLGLSLQTDGIAIDVLKRLNVSPEEIRRQTHRVMQEPFAETPTKQPAAPLQPSGLTHQFTNYAKGALSLAYVEAKRLQATRVGTEHLLLALILYESGVARRALINMGFEVDVVQNEVAKLTNNQQRDENANLELDIKTQEVLTLAADEARELGHHDIGTEHLLLGLVRQTESNAIDVLKRLNISLEDIRNETHRIGQDAVVIGKSATPVPTSIESGQRSGEPRLQTHKMERFTQRARRVLSLAQEEAERLQHSYIGTEHMLLGLMREEGGVAGRVLRDLGVDPHRVEELVERMTRAGQRTPNTRLDLSPGTKKILELAVDEARRMGHHYIGTEHLLLGLVSQTDGTAIDVLKRLNISPEEVRRHIRRVLQESPVQGKQPIATPQPSQQPYELPRQVEPQRFAGEWRITLAIARAEAIRLKSKFIEPEHLLVSLLLDEGDRTGKLLRIAGVDLEKVLEQIQASRVIASEPVLEVEMSPKMVEVLGLATAASWKSHNYYIQVEHLLLGLLHQKENAAIELLKQHNVSLEELEKATRESLQE